MRVFKFGGASVRSAEGVRNLVDIVNAQSDSLFVIVSAMGKTTNALERVLEHFVQGRRDEALSEFAAVESCHRQVMDSLFGAECVVKSVEVLFDEVYALLKEGTYTGNYELCYDHLVSYGELLSTRIISEYLNLSGVQNQWVDMRQCFITEGRHRDANINIELSTPLLRARVDGCDKRFFVGQGFIGASSSGETTTLGREGSDYSAAVAAYILDCESVSIWKDVEGILNADPKIFSDALYIPELTYLDAIELAYSGAQIIHPKTIKPLQNKNIPLYVRPFSDKTKVGSVIKGEIQKAINVPILIVKHNQVLISVRPKDFSFVVEERLVEIFSLLERYGIKVNLIQSSAVNLSLCVDNSRHLDEVVHQLQSDDFRVVYNGDMELLTIRGYDSSQKDMYAEAEGVYLAQKTRRILRVVRKK